MEIIAIANQKGGVGKTTTAINLAHLLSVAGKKCLLIDLDPQANATSGLGLVSEHTLGVYPVLAGEKNIAAARLSSAYPGLDVLVASPLMNDFESGTGLKRIPPLRLRVSLSAAGTPLEYDYILIDCPPSFGIFSLNALVAAQQVIIPIQCEYYAMEGLSQMANIIEEVKNKHNPDLRIGGILLTMYDHNIQFCREVAEEVNKHFPEQVYRTVILRDIAIAESASFGQPIMVYDPVSRGTYAYIEFCREILSPHRRPAEEAGGTTPNKGEPV